MTDSPAKSLRVMIVDDRLDLTDTTAKLLALWGHEARTALSGPEALSIAPGFRPDVVLLDIDLPGMSGYEVAAHFRADPLLADTVLVVMTGYADDDCRRRSEEAGVAHHLVKPVMPDELEGLLKGLAQQRATLP
jgi:CheY-like chemotaxis protein